MENYCFVSNGIRLLDSTNLEEPIESFYFCLSSFVSNIKSVQRFSMWNGRRFQVLRPGLLTVSFSLSELQKKRKTPSPDFHSLVLSFFLSDKFPANRATSTHTNTCLHPMVHIHRTSEANAQSAPPGQKKVIESRKDSDVITTAAPSPAPSDPYILINVPFDLSNQYLMIST